jgi:hypothetical protein
MRGGHSALLLWSDWILVLSTLLKRNTENTEIAQKTQKKKKGVVQFALNQKTLLFVFLLRAFCVFCVPSSEFQVHSNRHAALSIGAG